MSDFPVSHVAGVGNSWHLWSPKFRTCDGAKRPPAQRWSHPEETSPSPHVVSTMERWAVLKIATLQEPKKKIWKIHHKGRSFWDPMDCHSYVSLLEATGCYGSVPWYSDCGRFWPIPFSPIGNDWWTPGRCQDAKKSSKWVSVKNRHGNGPNRKSVN